MSHGTASISTASVHRDFDAFLVRHTAGFYVPSGGEAPVLVSTDNKPLVDTDVALEP